MVDAAWILPEREVPMFRLYSSIAFVVAVAVAGCIGDTSRDASAPKAETQRPAVGGGPRDPYPYPDWCSAYDSPVPTDMSSMPPPGASHASTGLDPCPPVVPPLGPPPPAAPSPARTR